MSKEKGSDKKKFVKNKDTGTIIVSMNNSGFYTPRKINEEEPNFDIKFQKTKIDNFFNGEKGNFYFLILTKMFLVTMMQIFDQYTGIYSTKNDQIFRFKI